MRKRKNMNETAGLIKTPAITTAQVEEVVYKEEFLDFPSVPIKYSDEFKRLQKVRPSATTAGVYENDKEFISRINASKLATGVRLDVPYISESCDPHLSVELLYGSLDNGGLSVNEYIKESVQGVPDISLTEGSELLDVFLVKDGDDIGPVMAISRVISSEAITVKAGKEDLIADKEDAKKAVSDMLAEDLIAEHKIQVFERKRS